MPARPVCILYQGSPRSLAILPSSDRRIPSQDADECRDPDTDPGRGDSGSTDEPSDSSRSSRRWPRGHSNKTPAAFKANRDDRAGLDRCDRADGPGQCSAGRTDVGGLPAFDRSRKLAARAGARAVGHCGRRPGHRHRHRPPRISSAARRRMAAIRSISCALAPAFARSALRSS